VTRASSAASFRWAPLGERAAERLPVPHPLPRAQGLCATTEPPLRTFTSAAHQAACHFPLREPEPGLVPAAESAAP
jgi:hypothetical protein